MRVWRKDFGVNLEIIRKNLSTSMPVRDEQLRIAEFIKMNDIMLIRDIISTMSKLTIMLP